MGDNRRILVKGIGSIPFVTTSCEEKLITSVLYVPYLCKNLLSVSQMAKHKMSVLFENETVVVRSKDTGNSVSQGAEEHGLDRLCPLLV